MITITKEKYEAYEGTRRSGVTNMFDLRMVMEISGLTREECLDIMKNYTNYRDQFGDGRPTQAQNE